MGASASTNLFDYNYQQERLELRRQLMVSFNQNLENSDVLGKIAAVRSIIIQHPDICATAAEEASIASDHNPTNVDAAFAELDRLIIIYETSCILKSAQCRVGPVACPLGHHAVLMETIDYKRKDKRKICCNICDKPVKSGYHCSFCLYNLCLPCSTVYCCNGHATKLWTHAEAQHSCVVCSRFPIHSGYRCTICEDYDICDYCTYKDGRDAVQQIILERMRENLFYMENHQTESETALKTVATHRKKVAEKLYLTTLHLHEFSETMKELRIICEAEVRQTRITKEVLRLRALVCVHPEYSATALRESQRDGNFTVEEIDRLKILQQFNEREMSYAVRSECIAACPLGHGLKKYHGRPLLYLKRDSLVSQNGKPFSAICKICERLAEPEGYHCEFCEYDLCPTCVLFYCPECHPTKMWIVPDAHHVSCALCNAQHLSAGYCCKACNVNYCDLCTVKPVRDGIRRRWENEMKALLKFMKDNRRLSDVAMFYHWRQMTVINSMGLLCEFVNELRTAKVTVERQVQQKDIIDKIKELRAEVVKYPDLCATAAREAARSKEYIFPTKKRALKEANRLSNLLKSSQRLQAADCRARYGIACPLGHGCDIIDGESKSKFEYADVKEDAFPPVIESFKGTLDDKLAENPLISFPSEIDLQLHQTLEIYHEEEKCEVQARACRICGVAQILGGYTCSYCEYDLCRDCGAVYCRLGHQLKIWTLPDAYSLSCEICKKSPIHCGYRCLICAIDICDMCTTKDCRNAFMFWPRREIRKIMGFIESVKDESDAARSFLDEEKRVGRTHADSMSLLCSKLNTLNNLKAAIEEEFQCKKSRITALKYGQIAKDM